MKKIVLASASPRRLELLNQVGLKFIVVPSDVEEKLDEQLSPEKIAEKLASEKALSVAGQVDYEAIVIGADTIVVKEAVLGKPRNDEEAFSMLKLLQGDWHEVITGIALIDTATSSCNSSFEKTRVKMRSLTDREIKAYIATDEPRDKAGAYGIQGIGSLLVERIEGDYFNVVGLPLQKLSLMLKAFDINVL